MRRISVTELALWPSRFDIFTNTREVEPSLISSGLVQPLPVCRQELIWGFSIVRAAINGKVDSLNCIEIDANPAQLLLLALRLENRVSEYSLEEQAAVARLADSIGVDGEKEAISRAVNGNSGFFPRISRFLVLPDYVQPHVASKRLDLKTATRVSDLPGPVFDLACSFPGFSHSTLRIFLTNLYDIAERDGISGDGIESLARRAIDSGDPATFAHQVRSPALTDLADRFKTATESALAGSGIVIDPPPFFEGDAYSVTFTFSGAGELRSRIKSLEKLEGACDELEDLL